MASKKEKTKTVTLYARRLRCGVSCGKYGILGFKGVPGKIGSVSAGVLGYLLEEWEPLGDDSVVEVTVTVKKKTRAKINPWYTKMLQDNRRCKAELKRRAAYEKQLEASWGGKKKGKA